MELGTDSLGAFDHQVYQVSKGVSMVYFAISLL